MTPCALCHKPTNGSIGAAGIRWANICQECKDIEDKALLDRIKGMVRATKGMDMSLGKLMEEI